MARTDTLNNFLTDVADAIRTKTGSTASITASDFDTEIENIPTSGGSPTDYFNGDYANSTDAEQNFFFRKYYVKPINNFPDIDCTGKTTLVSFFENCKWAKIPRLKNTSSVTNMSGLFSNCNYLETVDLSLIDTSNVTGTGLVNLFSYCTALTSIDLSSFDFQQVTSFAGMFTGCQNAVINLGTNNSPNLTNMAGMFSAACTRPGSSTNLDLSHLDLSHVTNASSAFSNSSNYDNIQSITLPTKASGRFFSNALTNMSSMFYGRQGLQYIPLNDFDTSNVTDFRDTFRGCVQATFGTNPTMSVKSSTSAQATFLNCNELFNLTLIDIPKTFYLINFCAGAFRSQDPNGVTTLKLIGEQDATGSDVYVQQSTFSYLGGHAEHIFEGDHINLNLSHTSTSGSYLPFRNCRANKFTFKNFNILQLNMLGYQAYVVEWNFDNCDFSNCTRFYRTFYSLGVDCKRIKIPGLTGLNGNFVEFITSASGLELLDIRDFLFSQGASTSIFNPSTTNIPANCTIVVKDATEKTAFTTAWPTYTNVMTVAEYEA
jgi:surface protein